MSRSTRRHLILIVVCAAFVLPFVVMLLTAFKTPDDIFRLPPSLLPTHWVGSNFAAVFNTIPVLRYFLNSLLLVVLTVTGSLLSCPLVAYALAKHRWPGRGLAFALVLGTMMLPPQVTLIPVFLIWDKLGMLNTYVPLAAPAFFGAPFFIFMLRQFFMNVPDELLDAARIDGAGEFRIYWQIVLPLAKSALATVAVFQFVTTWTDFFGPLVYLQDESKFTLPVGLFKFVGEHGTEWGPMMAACAMFTLPAIVIFMIAQRYFIQGIATSGLK